MLAVTKVLLDDPLPHLVETAGPDRSTAKTISDVRRMHAPHWKCFQIDGTLVSFTSISHSPSIAVTQRKRKRKNSDGEYTPHQRFDNNQSTTSSARRTSKRLAVSARPEEQSDVTTSKMPSRSTFTERSSSSTSALTSASSSSFDRLPTPKELDTCDHPVSISKPRFKIKRKKPRSPSPEIDWSDADDFSGWDGRFFSSVKIGFPPKEKKAANDNNYPASASYRLIKVGDRFRHIPYLQPSFSYGFNIY